MSRPGKRHGMICGNVTRILGNFAVQRKKGYVCSNDTGVVVERKPDPARGPDVLFIDDEEGVPQMEEKYGETPPLLAVVVHSPIDTVGNVMRRVREQKRFGTRLIWVLDPDANNVIVSQPGKEDKIVEAAEELTGEDILPDFRCRVTELFAFPGKS